MQAGPPENSHLQMQHILQGANNSDEKKVKYSDHIAK